MSEHLITTPVAIATCPRCHEYVFACLVDGIDTLADMKPLTTQSDYVQHLVDTRRTFDTTQLQNGVTHKLITRTPSSRPFNADDPTHPILGEHSCGVLQRDATRAELVPVTPPSAPVTPGRHPDGHHPQPAPEKAPQGHTASPAARHANPRPSNPIRCDQCNERIRPDEPHVAIEHGPNYRWGQHVECKPTAYQLMVASWSDQKEMDSDGYRALINANHGARTIEIIHLPKENNDEREV
ncbi:hypothetical protein [Streptomyces sp. NPDC048611]|uniref:hypothetical protein n=1 Tax=Streptomyces sp. NPDC048611 TaxID=3155635 RepID=UPI00342D65CF